jgi:hypothetical protein
LEIVRLWEEGEVGIRKERERRVIWKREEVGRGAGVGRDRAKKRKAGAGVHGRVYLTVN